jgi:hypothetical protein
MANSLSSLVPVITRVNANEGNPGDGFIRWGMEYIFEKCFNQQIQWLLINKFDKRDLLKYEELIRGAGFIIYAGTPQYNNYDDWKLWYDDEMYKILKDWGVDFISIAGGAGIPQIDWSKERFSKYCIGSDTTVELLKLRSELGSLFSVRDKYARQLLNDLGISNHLLPCTATWASSYCNINKKSNEYIALVPPGIGVMPPEQAGARNPREADANLLETYQMLEQGIGQKFPGKNIRVVPHGAREHELFGKALHHSKIFYSNNAQSLLEFYSNCEFVISGRLHGALPAFGIEGTKVVSIETDTRGSATELFDKIHRVKLRSIAKNKENISNLVKNLDKIEPSEGKDMLFYQQQYEKLLKEHFST